MSGGGDSGGELKAFFKVAWPVCLEYVLLSLITSCDMMMVGDLGINAISAVNLTDQPRLLMLVPIQALNVGVLATVGRCFGAKDREGANRCLRYSLCICAAIAAVMLTFILVFTRPIITFCGALPETLEMSVDYMRITSIGAFFSYLGLTITSAQRGIGRTKLSLFTNFTANILNLGLNYLLIQGRFGFPALGVKGAAIATATGHVVAFLIAVFSALPSGGFLHLTMKLKKVFRAAEIKQTVLLSWNVALERLCQRVGMLLYVKVVASLGTVAFAAFSICSRFNNIAYSFADAMAVAAAALVSQSIGARSVEKAKAYSRAGMKITLGVALCLSVLFFVLRGPVGALFVDSAEADAAQVLQLVKTCMLVVCVSIIPLQLASFYMGVLRGVDEARYVALVILICTAIVRPLLTGTACHLLHGGLAIAYIMVLLDIALRFVLIYRRYRTSNWEQRVESKEDSL